MTTLRTISHRAPHAIFALVCLFAALASSPFSSAQDEPTQQPAALKYTFRPVNVPGASTTKAFAINNSGEIVGYYVGSVGGCSQQSCAFIDIKGKFTYFECALNYATDAFDVNNLGEVIGATSVIGGVTGYTWGGDDLCNPVTYPNAAVTETWGVNDSGTIVGWSGSSDSGPFTGFSLTTAGTYTTLMYPGAVSTRAYGINNAGVIIGDYEDSSGNYHGFLYKSGKYTAINFPKAAQTYGRGINNNNEISGFYTDASGNTHGWVKPSTTFYTLNYPAALYTLLYDLNDHGQIAGYYEDSSNVVHGLVATPAQ